jgi:hypothetical protein
MATPMHNEIFIVMPWPLHATEEQHGWISCQQGLVYTMDQISIKTPNPKCRLFSKFDQ